MAAPAASSSTGTSSTTTRPFVSSGASKHADASEEGVDYGDGDNQEMTDDDRELEAMKARVREMEQEAAKLREMQAVAEREMAAANGSPVASAPGDGSASPGVPILTEEEKHEIDSRSIHVGNVDFSATPEEIQQHFASCGTINRVTILVDKFTGHPKGYAFVEFADPSIVPHSLELNGTEFKGRPLKVAPKRTNVPHFMLPGARGRGRGRGGYRGGHGGFRGGYHPYGRPPRPYRGRGRGGF